MSFFGGLSDSWWSSWFCLIGGAMVNFRMHLGLAFIEVVKGLRLFSLWLLEGGDAAWEPSAAAAWRGLCCCSSGPLDHLSGASQ